MKKLKFDINTIRPQGVELSPQPLTSSDFTFKNPLDLFPADIVTIQAIQKALSETPDGKPLVILAGEMHNKSAHVLSHIAPLLYLQDCQKDFLFAYELSCNVLTGLLADEYNLSYPKNENIRWNLSEEENFLAQYLLADKGYDSHNPPSIAHLFRTILATNLPVFFNDVALKAYDEFILREDPLVQKQIDILKSKGLEFDENKILPWEKIGDAIRHGVMAERAITEMKERGVSILYQHLGVAHLLGWDDKSPDYDSVPYEGCLALRHRDNGAHVLPILSVSELCVPPEIAVDPRAWKDFPNTVIKRNIGETVPSEDDVQSLFNHYSGVHCPLEYGRNITISPPTREQLQKALRSSRNGKLKLNFL